MKDKLDAVDVIDAEVLISEAERLFIVLMKRVEAVERSLSRHLRILKDCTINQLL